MKKTAPLNRSAAALILAVLFSAPVSGQGPGDDGDDERGILPVAPRELWSVMPGKLKTWKLVRSTAEKRLGGWIESRAVREYEKISDPPGADGGDNAPKPAVAGPPTKTRLVITDTGKHPGAVAPFANFAVAPDTEGEPEDGVMIGLLVNSFPAFQTNYGEEEIVLEILVAGRFIVEITIFNQPEKFLKEWTRRIDLAALTKIPETEVVPLPESVILMKLDQLNPKRNSAYRLATTSNRRQEQELREDEDFLREVIGELPEIPEEETEEPDDQ